jgi:hypothetical protein
MKLKLIVVSALFALMLLPVASVNKAADGFIAATEANAAPCAEARLIGGPPPFAKAISSAAARARNVALLKRDVAGGGHITAEGQKLMRGKDLDFALVGDDPTALSDNPPESAGVVVISTNVPTTSQDSAANDSPRELQSRTRKTGYGTFSFWCGYGVAVQGTYIVGSGWGSATGVWLDYGNNMGSKHLGSTSCAFWEAPCRVVVGWDPAYYRMAYLLDLDWNNWVDKAWSTCLYYG